MKKFLLILATLVAGATLVATDADAARLGGGRSFGMQRNYTPPPTRQAAPVVRPQPPAAAPAPAASRWPSMLGGLAIGGLLGSMLGGGGAGGLLLLVLVVLGVFILARVLRRGPQAPPEQDARPVRDRGFP
jgi:predicted lipid-binding transport protein (Tim44 family)